LGITAPAYAGFLSMVGGILDKGEKTEVTSTANSQNVALLQAAIHLDPNPAKGGGDTTIIGDALLPDSGPLGTAVDIKDSPSSDQISVYVVREGDSLSQIAEMFQVSVNTIRWANDLGRTGTIKPDDTLVILPVTGIKHSVAAGDTIEKIAAKYKASAEEISVYNGIDLTSKLTTGSVVIVPDGVFVEVQPAKKPVARVATGSTRSATPSANVSAGYFLRPINGGVKTQGIHGYNGIDLAAPVGTPVFASAAGRVIVSRTGGWNGGYGTYIVIEHPNGTQTLYAHLSGNNVSQGQTVTRGQVIGAVGNTGRSTGPHIHFEVRGGRNPF
jgi:murein DD-endopeptidase MepM/ murein hydrolase activator NlpD